MSSSLILALSLLVNPINENIKPLPSENTEVTISKSLTISWENINIDELELRSEYDILIPSILTEGSMQIHLNDLTDGNYYLILKSEGNVREIREFEVENMVLLAMNNIETK